MSIDLTLRNIFGTGIEYKTEKSLFGEREVLVERGMFNALGYMETHEIKSREFNINELIKIFDRLGHVRNN